MKITTTFILSICLFSFYAYPQKTIRSEKHKLTFEFNDEVWEPIHALNFEGFKAYVAEAMPGLDLFYGLNPKNSNGLNYPYILLGVETVENPPFDELVKDLNGVSLEKKEIEETVGAKLDAEITDIKTLKPIFDREAALFIIMSKLDIEEEEFPVINVQVFKMGKNKRALISLYTFDDEHKEKNLKEFWKIVYNFKFDEKYAGY